MNLNPNKVPLSAFVGFTLVRHRTLLPDSELGSGTLPVADLRALLSADTPEKTDLAVSITYGRTLVTDLMVSAAPAALKRPKNTQQSMRRSNQLRMLEGAQVTDPVLQSRPNAASEYRLNLHSVLGLSIFLFYTSACF